MNQIKILIIDDSNIVHVLLERILADNKEISIIGEAYDGEEGFRLVKELSPDVVIMDIGMPKMGGLEAIQEIMNEKPTPIIVFSAASKDIVDLGFRAIEYGAVDIIEKPYSEDLSLLRKNIEDNLLKSIVTFADFKVIRRLKKKEIAPLHDYTPKVNETIEERLKKKKAVPYDRVNKDNFPIIGIATSTGGPQTLRNLIENLSDKKIFAGYVIVQHMAEGFMQGFCDWLGEYSSIPVVFPKEGEYINEGYVYIAPGEHHLIFDKNGRFSFLNSPPVQGIMPSADIMLSSLAEVYRQRVIAVILTGMGNDGTQGLKKVKEYGGYVISQDEESSLIFGMPKSAIDSGVVDSVLNLSQIPDFLEKICNSRQ